MDIEAERADIIAEAKRGEFWQGPPYIGKFDSELGEALWTLTMVQGQDEETGDCQEFGAWYGLFRDAAAILETMDSGAVYACVYDTVQGAEQAFAERERSYATFLDSDDDDEPAEPVPCQAWRKLAGILGPITVYAWRCNDCHDIRNDTGDEWERGEVVATHKCGACGYPCGDATDSMPEPAATLGDS